MGSSDLKKKMKERDIKGLGGVLRMENFTAPRLIFLTFA